MSEADAGWFRLLVDCLGAGQPSGSLLVRYLLSPEVLTDDERVLLEDRIERDPQIADQVEVLRRILTSSKPLLDKAKPKLSRNPHRAWEG